MVQARKRKPPADARLVLPGDRGTLYLNQRFNPCTVLGVLGNEAIIEVEMPHGTTCLNFISAWDYRPTPPPPEEYEGIWRGQFKIVRPNPYGFINLPMPWIKAIVDAGMDWKAVSKNKRPIPTPFDLMMDRHTRGSDNRNDWNQSEIEGQRIWSRRIHGKLCLIEMERTPEPIKSYTAIVLVHKRHYTKRERQLTVYRGESWSAAARACAVKAKELEIPLFSRRPRAVPPRPWHMKKRGGG